MNVIFTCGGTGGHINPANNFHFFKGVLIS